MLVDAERAQGAISSAAIRSPSSLNTYLRSTGLPIGSLRGRWKLVILFHLFGGKVLRFSDLERAIPDVTQKMLAQQLRQLERDGMVRRIVHAQVPPKVEYALTAWGQALCPALDALLRWRETRTAEP